MSAKEKERWSSSQARPMLAEERGNSGKCLKGSKLEQILNVREQLQGKEDKLIEIIQKDKKSDDENI